VRWAMIDEPKPQTALNGHVPLSVLEQLRSAGMIKSKMLLKAWRGRGDMADKEESQVPKPL
jgi:hypothetical protein